MLRLLDTLLTGKINVLENIFALKLGSYGTSVQTQNEKWLITRYYDYFAVLHAGLKDNQPIAGLGKRRMWYDLIKTLSPNTDQHLFSPDTNNTSSKAPEN